MTWRSSLVSPLVAGLLLASLAGAATMRAEAADCSKAGTNDFDGDGRDDVVAGDPLADAGGVREAGAVHILPAREGGSDKGIVVTAPDPHAGDGFGWTVRTAHIDGDRCLDVVVGAPYADAEGRTDAGEVYVIYGGGVTPQAPRRISPPKPERDAHFGWTLAAAAPTGQPGVIAVGAPYENADKAADSGAVYVYSTMEGREPGAPKRVTQGSEGIVGNSEGGDMFGWSLVFGHLGGRAGSPDLVIGTPYENDDGIGKQAASSGKADTGAIEVVFDVAEPGTAYQSVKWGIVKSVAEHPGDRYGYALAYAEFKGMPYLAASAPLADVGGVTDSGLVQVFQLDRAGKLTPTRTIRTEAKGLDEPGTANATLGWSLAMVGTPKALYLAIGSPFDSRGASEAGVIRGVPLIGDQSGRLLTLGDPHPHEHFGWSLAPVGAPDSFTAGTGLVAGVPDGHATPGGAVAILQEDKPTRLLSPGRDGVPPVPGGSSTDFGASVSG